MENLTRSDFETINFGIVVADIDGGFFKRGGTSVTINMQSRTLFIDKGEDRRSWPIRSFKDALNQANNHLQNKD